MINKKTTSFLTEISKEIKFFTNAASKALFLTEMSKTVSLPIDITTNGNWILTTGFWDDGGAYDDFNVWID